MESRDILSRLNTSVCLRERLAAIFFGGVPIVLSREIRPFDGRFWQC